jgi:uncharacterized glyoxalase superfamily protein PhnB
MPWLSPYLMVKDADAALDFYQRAFGFEKREAVKGQDGRTQHAEMAYREAIIMFSPEAPEKGYKAPGTLGIESTTSLYLYCDNVDALCARAKAAGARVMMEPQDSFWGDRYCLVTDPDGNRWCWATWLGPSYQPKSGTSCGST